MDAVALSGSALLKILKACAGGTAVSGVLTGIELETAVHVECAVAVPPEAPSTWLVDMLKLIAAVNASDHQVGLFAAMPSDQVLGGEQESAGFWLRIISELAVAQTKNPRAVLVLCDPQKITLGLNSIKAFRLSCEFLSLYKLKQKNHLDTSPLLKKNE
jgi:hypothetical protein